MLRIILIMVMFGLLIVGGIFMFFYASENQGAVESARDAIIQQVDPDPEAPIIERFDKEKVIAVTGAGFVPQELSAPPFEEVIWVNQTDSPIYIEHYNENTDDKKTFEIGEILPGESESVVYFAYKGRYRYWDRYHPERIGFINVE